MLSRFALPLCRLIFAAAPETLRGADAHATPARFADFRVATMMLFGFSPRLIRYAAAAFDYIAFHGATGVLPSFRLLSFSRHTLPSFLLSYTPC